MLPYGFLVVLPLVFVLSAEEHPTGGTPLFRPISYRTRGVCVSGFFTPDNMKRNR